MTWWLVQLSFVMVTPRIHEVAGVSCGMVTSAWPTYGGGADVLLYVMCLVLLWLTVTSSFSGRYWLVAGIASFPVAAPRCNGRPSGWARHPPCGALPLRRGCDISGDVPSQEGTVHSETKSAILYRGGAPGATAKCGIFNLLPAAASCAYPRCGRINGVSAVHGS
jgi:hypothetical protein